MKTKEELLNILEPVINISEKMLLSGVLKKNVIKHLTNRGFTLEAAKNILELAENRANEFTHYKINGVIYNADEIIGKTLYLKAGKQGKLYNAIGGNKIYILQGGYVGVVYMYIQRPNEFWWMVERGNEKFFIKHEENIFDVKALQNQGTLTTEEIIKRKEEAEKAFSDKLLDKGTDLLKKGLFIYLGFNLLSKLITR